MDMINFQRLDQSFKNQIATEPDSTSILKYSTCELCNTHYLEKNNESDWNLPFIIRKALLGREEVLSSKFIWIYRAYYQCLEKSPQSVDVKAVMHWGL